MRLKDEDGRVIEIGSRYCYPLKNGTVTATLVGFAYFVGRPTVDAPTHYPRLDSSLAVRGDLVKIEKREL